MNTRNHFENMNQVNYPVLQMGYYSLMTLFWKAYKGIKKKENRQTITHRGKEIILIKGKWGKI